MIFGRRQPETFIERLRVWLWPRRSLRRSLKYFGKRILRIAATPHAVALGLAIGVFCACSPLIGFHIIIAVIVSWLVRANIAAAILGTAFANPLSIPFVIGFDYEIGHHLLALFGQSEQLPLGNIVSMLQEKSVLEIWEPVVKPTLLGSLVFGGVWAIIAYGLAFWGTSRFQKRRREKLAEKHHLRMNGSLKRTL